MDERQIREQYKSRKECYLDHIVEPLRCYITEILSDYPRIDRICTRPKDIASYTVKALKRNDNGDLKYNDPINQIQDQVGARIVTYYLTDLQNICEIVKKNIRHIEEQRFIPDSANEFGYEGRHFILFIPEDIIPSKEIKEHLPPFFELQIKTLFQHAWGEASHDIGYKPDEPLSYEQQRKISFTAAQAWGADMIFDEFYKQSEKHPD